MPGDIFTQEMGERIGTAECERLFNDGKIRPVPSSPGQYDTDPIDELIREKEGNLDPNEDASALGAEDLHATQDDGLGGDGDQVGDAVAEAKTNSKEGPWNIDPSLLIAKELPELIVIIQDIDPNTSVPATVEEAVAILSRQYDPAFDVARDRVQEQ